MNENMNYNPHEPNQGQQQQEQAPPPPSPAKQMADRMADELKKCNLQYERMKSIAEELQKRGDISAEAIETMKKNAEEQLSSCIETVTRKYRSATEHAFAGKSGSGPRVAGDAATEFVNRLFRSDIDKMIAGVCGGLGENFKVDSSVIRVLFVLLAFWPFPGFSILVYIVLSVILPLKTASGEMRRMF